MSIYGYARVSTLDQDLSIQRVALEMAGCAVIRAEKASGTRRAGRSELQILLDFLRAGDTLVVTRIERAPSNQQILVSGVGTPFAEKLSNLVEVGGQELAGEVQRQRLPEIEISLVGYWQKFLGVVDVIRQYVQVVAELE